MITAFIPAKGQSKSIPNKNKKELNGKPLVVYSIDSAFKAGINKVVVDTDDEEIAKIARDSGAEVMMRPKELAQDKTSMFEVLQAEIPKIDPLPDLVLLLQPTVPFRKKIHIQAAVSYMQENIDKYDSVISVFKVPDKYHPYEAIISSMNDKMMAMGTPVSKRATRRQDYPEAWIPTGAIYLFQTKNLVKGSFYGNNIMLLQTEEELNINEPSDWEKAEQLCQKSTS